MTNITNYKHPSLLGMNVVDGLFDSFFVDFPRHLKQTTQGYPVADIYSDDSGNTVMEFALAGFSKDDIKVHLEDGVLTVESTDSKTDDDREYVHQGIAKRSFKRSWTLSDDIEVKHADLIDGMLTIELEKIFPEGKEPREIPIGTFKG